MAAQVQMGIMGIVFGVLLLLVGLTFGTSLIIDQVNRQGGKIGCFDGDDILISNAKYITGNTAADNIVPKKASATFQGPLAVGKPCGNGTLTVKSGTTVANGAGTGSMTSEGGKVGTIRYTLEVFGADSLNNLMTLAFWIVLIMIAISLIGAGGYAVRGALA